MWSRTPVVLGLRCTSSLGPSLARKRTPGLAGTLRNIQAYPSPQRRAIHTSPTQHSAPAPPSAVDPPSAPASTSPATLRTGPLAPGIAFITGGARGLGNAIAQSFAREGSSGIVLVDIADAATFATGQAAVEAYGTPCLCIHADVTSETDVESAVATAVQKFGRIDYAANFAGIVGPLTPIVETDTQAWKRVMGVNSLGVWLSMKYQLKQMLSQTPLTDSSVEPGRWEQRGSIVNAASVNSILSGAGTSGYTAAKHAVAGMTKAACLESRSGGVRVNAVSPGFLLTKLLEAPIESGQVPMGVFREYEARQGREGKFEEVGDVVVLLSSPRMGLVNGANLAIDNGFTINENTF